jgi:hypothetical protein
MINRKNRIMIFGLNPDGTYVGRIQNRQRRTLAILVPSGETAVLKHFQERMPHGLFVPDVEAK